ncbi:MAG: hypothetical protein IKN78_10420 [Bacteroidales bacterium]|nr:hypothetical protein [Bacteroidales bacterium]
MKKRYIIKKHIITLLLVGMFAGASAQNDTQSFDSVFRHVDLNHTTTGILYERVLPFDDLPLCNSSASNFLTNRIDSTDSMRKTHSVGINLGWTDGVSLKFNIEGNVYLQSDIGINMHFLVPIIPIPFDIGCDVKAVYEKKFSKATNTCWFAGGGLSFGIVPHSKKDNGISFKESVLSIFGIEYMMDSHPLSVQFDARFGYGIIHTPKVIRPDRIGFPNDNPYHFLDFGIVFSLRYHFGK